MNSSLRILKRFIISTMLISAFLLIVNFILLGVWTFRGLPIKPTPAAAVKQVAGDLTLLDGTYSLKEASVELMDKNQLWSMLLDDQGHILWNYKLPAGLSKTYSLLDVAKFTKGYLADYPVFVWEQDNHLLVLGYPKNSLVKYQHILPTGLVSSLPGGLLLLLGCNLVLALLLSLLIGSRLIRSIRPLTTGIEALAQDEKVFVAPKGILSDLSDRINQASALLQQRGDALKTRDQARSNWIAGISHDIRTPLSMILGYAGDMEENASLPPEQQKQAGIIRKQAEQLRSLVNDLNLVSMLEYDMQPLNKKQIRLAALARRIASDFINNGMDDIYQLEIHIKEEGTRLLGDERLLTRAITNLIQNSIRHNPQGCCICLEVDALPEEDSCCLLVKDTGKGVPEEALSHLLALPFTTQGKSAAENSHGLGLPMAAQIARAHHGTLYLSGEPGKGLCAKMVLPALPPG